MTGTAPSHAVVVGVDGSAASTLALDWAVDEARRRTLPLHLLTAWSVRFAQASPMVVAPLDAPDPEGILREAADRVRSLAPSVRVTTESTGSSPSAALVEASHTAECVVLGSRGHSGLGSAIVGSTSMQVATHAACPVVVVREVTKAGDSRPGVVVGIDGSPVSTEAIHYAFAQAASRGVGLVAVHAWHVEFVEGGYALGSTEETWDRLMQEEYAVTSESLAGLAEQYPDVDVTRHVVREHPVAALVTMSQGAELLVVGSRGLGGFRALLIGSVSQGVLHRAHCPVAVVRPRAGKRGG